MLLSRLLPKQKTHKNTEKLKFDKFDNLLHEFEVHRSQLEVCRSQLQNQRHGLNQDAGLVRVVFSEDSDRVYVYTLCGRVLETTAGAVKSLGITHSTVLKLSTTQLVFSLLSYGACDTDLSLSVKAQAVAAGLCHHLVDTSLDYTRLNVGGVRCNKLY